MREYQNGHIYWHPNTGAYEVHGGILGVYLANGGPGVSPTTGKRELGYPTSDELGGTVPISRFEFADIYWTPGSGGCLVPFIIRGRLAQGAGVGLPMTSPIAVAGGEAVFFESGVIFSAYADGQSRVVVGRIEFSRIGHPRFIDPGSQEDRTFNTFCTWSDIDKHDYDALLALHPAVFTDILNDRYVYSPVGRRDQAVPMTVTGSHTFGTFRVDVKVGLALAAGGPQDLQDRTLYDFSLLLPNGNQIILSPHSLYTKKSWDDFGLLHATDIHISKRNDNLRDRLNAVGLTDAAAKYCNFQDNLRDFIKYANKLHDLGLADVVLATGDLVDYAKEDIGDDDPYSNFWRLRQILLGKPIDGSLTVGEELRLPILTTFGNHDYRIHPYDYKATVDLKVTTMHFDQYASHNLMESDAIAVQGNKVVTYGVSELNDAIRMLKTDQTRNSYAYYDGYFGGGLGYTVNLGRHRIVVMDTQMDEGIPEEINAALMIKWAEGDLNDSTSRLLSGTGPNSYGFTQPTIDKLRNAIAEAPLDGVVIIGMHAPALSPNSGQYPYYLRETLHPTADQAELQDYHGDNLAAMAGKTYFHVGDPKEKLGVGIGWNGNLEFLEACAGVGLPRPVDLILCGHVHDRVEYRFRSNGSQLEFYTDFYTENPRNYYAIKSVTDRPGLPKGSTIAVEIAVNATALTNVILERDHRTQPETIYGKAITPPYPTPLETATDPAAWWQAHRPLHVETASLGPIESRQRFGTFYEISYTLPIVGKVKQVVETDQGQPDVATNLPDQSITILPPHVMNPTFQGFRLIQVANNVIAKMRYITLADLRRKGFNLPWEPGLTSDLSNIITVMEVLHPPR
jgi:predicted MPP superfamily phosphohydrolase